MKKILISILILFISAIIHNLYNWFPNCITLIFSPVNESIWEHMKMIFTSYMIVLIVKYFYYKSKNKYTKNIIIEETFLSIINIIIFLIIYLPIYYLFGENLIITLIIYFITILITRLININKKYKYSLGILIIISIYSSFIVLSYNPPKLDIFRDPTNNTYGLNK